MATASAAYYKKRMELLQEEHAYKMETLKLAREEEHSYKMESLRLAREEEHERHLKDMELLNLKIETWSAYPNYQ